MILRVEKQAGRLTTKAVCLMKKKNHCAAEREWSLQEHQLPFLSNMSRAFVVIEIDALLTVHGSDVAPAPTSSLSS
jgi:hypothetical protein